MLSLLCHIFGALTRLTYIASLMSTCVLVFHRFVSLCRSDEPKDISRALVQRLLLVCWLFAMLIAQPFDLLYKLATTPSAFHLASFGASHFLLPSHLDTIIIGSCTLLADMLLLYCAFRILAQLRSLELRIRPVTALQPTDIRFQSELRTANSVLIVATSSVLIRTPFVATLIGLHCLDMGVRPHDPLQILWLLFWSQSCVNPLLYVTRNPHVAKWLRLRKNFNTSYVTATPTSVAIHSSNLEVVLERATKYQQQDVRPEDIEIGALSTNFNVLVASDFVDIKHQTQNEEYNNLNALLYVAQKRASQLSTITSVTELFDVLHRRGSTSV